MAAGMHRRIRWLTLARIVAASVVGLAFAATMVVVVLTAGLAPDNVRLSVTHGHFQSSGPLWSRYDLQFQHMWRNRNDTIAVYAPAKQLDVWVSMDAHDPSCRAESVCFDAVHVLDIPKAPSLEGMVNIATVYNTVATGNTQPCKQWRHKGSTTMRFDRWISLADPLMLCYISQNYGGITDFTVMLKVDMRILYPKEDRDSPEDHNEAHYCWPVTIGNSRNTRSEAVNCKPSHAIDYASYAPVLIAHECPCNAFHDLDPLTYPDLDIKQFSLLWFLGRLPLPLQSTAIPDEAKTLIMERLARVGSHGVKLTNGTAALDEHCECVWPDELARACDGGFAEVS